MLKKLHKNPQCNLPLNFVFPWEGLQKFVLIDSVLEKLLEWYFQKLLYSGSTSLIALILRLNKLTVIWTKIAQCCNIFTGWFWGVALCLSCYLISLTLNDFTFLCTVSTNMTCSCASCHIQVSKFVRHSFYRYRKHYLRSKVKKLKKTD